MTESLTQELVDEFVGVSHGDLARVKALLAEHSELLTARARWDESPIQAATHVRNIPIVEFLLAQGAPLDIHTAAILGEVDRVAAFLEADPELARRPGVHGFPPLYFPALVGNLEIGRLLLERGAEVNGGAGGNTPLHGAATFGQPAFAAWLCANGADLTAKDYQDRTPLAVALEYGSSDVADVLRSHGAEA